MKNQITPRDYELISAYLDNQLSSKERANLESRLSANPEMRKELQELNQTRLMLHSLPKLRAPHNYFINPKVVPIPVRVPRGLRSAPAMGIVSAIATILLVLVIFGQNLLIPTGPVAMAPAVEVPAESLAVEQEAQRNAESAPAATEEAPMAMMEAPTIPSPEPTTEATPEEAVGLLKAGETEVATPTTIYLYAYPPTATPTPQSEASGMGVLAGTARMTCEEYFNNPGAYPPPAYIADCPVPTGTPPHSQLDFILTASPTPSATSAPSLTPTPTNTPTPTSTETLSPTPTATPDPTDTQAAALLEAPAAADTGASEKVSPSAEAGPASPTIAADVPAGQSTPADQPAPSPNTDFIRYLVLAAEISLATIAIGAGITAIILRIRAGQ